MKNEKILMEELRRIKSLISYDNSMTADENSLNEALPAAIPYASTSMGFLAGGTTAAGAKIGTATATFLGLGPVGWTVLAVAGLAALGTWYFTKDTDTEKIKEIFEMCKTDPESKKWKKFMSEEQTYNVAFKLRRAMKGLGTDEKAVYSALGEFKSPGDFCSVSKKYERNYGESLFEAIDDDFDYGWDEIAKPLVKMIEEYATNEFEKYCKDNPDKCAEGLVEYCKKVPSDKKCEVLKNNNIDKEEKDKEEKDKEEKDSEKNIGDEIISQGETGDPYKYKKVGDEYFYALKKDGDNTDWTEAEGSGLEAIKSKIRF